MLLQVEQEGGVLAEVAERHAHVAAVDVGVTEEVLEERLEGALDVPHLRAGLHVEQHGHVHLSTICKTQATLVRDGLRSEGGVGGWLAGSYEGMGGGGGRGKGGGVLAWRLIDLLTGSWTRASMDINVIAMDSEIRSPMTTQKTTNTKQDIFF